jgi:hypothetical protein
MLNRLLPLRVPFGALPGPSRSATSPYAVMASDDVLPSSVGLNTASSLPASGPAALTLSSTTNTTDSFVTMPTKTGQTTPTSTASTTDTSTEAPATPPTLIETPSQEFEEGEEPDEMTPYPTTSALPPNTTNTPTFTPQPTQSLPTAEVAATPKTAVPAVIANRYE